MIFAFCQVAEKAREKNQELYMVFTKTFNTMNMEALWEVLKRLSIPDNILNVIISPLKG